MGGASRCRLLVRERERGRTRQQVGVHKMTAYISMMASTTNNNPSTALYNDKDQVSKDLDTIEREYIKKVLFPAVVKFLYDDKDLDKGGKLFGHFMQNCLTGTFKVGGGYVFTEDDTSNYLRFLWNNHVKEKGLCKKWLSNRRSTVYTVMQHKFRSKWI